MKQRHRRRIITRQMSVATVCWKSPAIKGLERMLTRFWSDLESGRMFDIPDSSRALIARVLDAHPGLFDEIPVPAEGGQP